MFRKTARSLLVAWLAFAVASLPAFPAATLTPDTDQSSRLTDFLKHNRLPLVTAQVLISPAGEQSVMLSGFTATELGKSNAEKRTRRFLRNSKIPITNRIKVRPELASMRSPASSQARTQPADSHSAQQLGDIEAYQQQRPEAVQRRYATQQGQQYMNQQNSSAVLVNGLIPLILMGFAIGLGGTGRGFVISPRVGPYGVYSSPYGGGYGYPNPYRPGTYGIPGASQP